MMNFVCKLAISLTGLALSALPCFSQNLQYQGPLDGQNSQNGSFAGNNGFTNNSGSSLNSILDNVEQGKIWTPPQSSGQFSNAASQHNGQFSGLPANNGIHNGANMGQGFQGGMMNGGGMGAGLQTGNMGGMMNGGGMGAGPQTGNMGGMMNGGMGAGPQMGNAQPFSLFGSKQQQAKPPVQPFSAKNLLRVFFEGGSPSGTAGSGNSAKTAEMNARNASVTGQAESLMSRATNQAEQAVADAERAHSGSDKGARLGAASSAQYHANDARAAADEAANLTYSGPQYAKDYAAQARAQANRAQEAADRAQYNAAQ